MKYNFITEENSDYGAYEFTLGSRGKFVSRQEMYENKTYPMCWPGFFQPQWLDICIQNNLRFYNFDGAYFGNKKKKTFFRLTVNSFQNTSKIINRPIDRWLKVGITLDSFTQGNEVVIVPPDQKICHAFKLGSIEDWIAATLKELKNYTDRTIKIRYRPQSRQERTTVNTFKDFIAENTFCVIGFSSNSLVEAAMCDIPVISLGHSATKSLYNYNLSQIEEIIVADQDKKQAWLNHLAYCQFTREELASGYAWDIINSEHT